MDLLTILGNVRGPTIKRGLEWR